MFSKGIFSGTRLSIDLYLFNKTFTESKMLQQAAATPEEIKDDMFTALPSDIWHQIIKQGYVEDFLCISKDIANITNDHINQNQYSILNNSNDGVRYYGKLRLTTYQVEMLELIRADITEYTIPDCENQAVIAVIYAMELVRKNGLKVVLEDTKANIIRNVLNRIEFANIISTIRVVSNRYYSYGVEFTLYPLNPMSQCYLDIFDISTVTVRIVDAKYKLRKQRNTVELLLGKDNVLPSFDQVEVTPVEVIVTSKYRPLPNEKVLKLSSIRICDLDIESARKLLKKTNEVKHIGIINSPRVFDLFDVIKISLGGSNYSDEIFTLLSQHSRKVKKLVVKKLKYIPMPFKVERELEETVVLSPQKTGSYLQLANLRDEERENREYASDKLRSCSLLIDPNQKSTDVPKVKPY